MTGAPRTNFPCFAWSTQMIDRTCIFVCGYHLFFIENARIGGEGGADGRARQTEGDLHGSVRWKAPWPPGQQRSVCLELTRNPWFKLKYVKIKTRNNICSRWWQVRGGSLTRLSKVLSWSTSTGKSSFNGSTSNRWAKNTQFALF